MSPTVFLTCLSSHLGIPYWLASKFCLDQASHLEILRRQIAHVGTRFKALHGFFCETSEFGLYFTSIQCSLYERCAKRNVLFTS